MECAIKIVSLWRTKNSHVCDEVSTIWAWKGQTGAALGGRRGGKRQIRTNFSEICVSSKSEGKSLTALEYDTIWFGARLMCEIYPSLQFKNMPQILSLSSFWENYTYQHSTRSEGILCMARVKGRRASSNHLGCSLREPNEAKHAP